MRRAPALCVDVTLSPLESIPLVYPPKLNDLETEGRNTVPRNESLPSKDSPFKSRGCLKMYKLSHTLRMDYNSTIGIIYTKT